MPWRVCLNFLLTEWISRVSIFYTMASAQKGFTGIEILVVLTVLSVLGSGAVVASDNARPGDALFGLDQALENIQERVTLDPVRKFELKVKRAQERAQELAELEQENETLPSLETEGRVTQATELTNQALQQAEATVSNLAESIPASDRSNAPETLQRVSALLQSLQQTKQETQQRITKLKDEVKDDETKQKLETMDAQGNRQVVKTEEKVDSETGATERRVKVYQINPDGTETKVLDIKEKQKAGKTELELEGVDELQDDDKPTGGLEPTEPEDEEEDESEDEDNTEPAETPEPSKTPRPTKTPEPTEAEVNEDEDDNNRGSGSSDDEDDESQTYKIRWKDGEFENANLSVRAGDSVEWENKEDDSIRITSADLPGLDSGTLQKGEEYKYTFTNSGSYTYLNQLSPSNTGTITVN